MKSLKIWSLVMLMVLAFTSCDNKVETPKPVGNSPIAGQWMLVEWNEEAPEFNVYADFTADGKFSLYQQVWSLDYECFTGTYTIKGDIVTGYYTDGTDWASGYKFEVSGDVLIMYSQEDQSVKSVYEKCEIPQEIIDEATTTRAIEVVPFL